MVPRQSPTSALSFALGQEPAVGEPGGCQLLLLPWERNTLSRGQTHTHTHPCLCGRPVPPPACVSGHGSVRVSCVHGLSTSPRLPMCPSVHLSVR